MKPYTHLINQSEWIEPNRPLLDCPLPRLTFRQRLFLVRVYRIDVRIEPPAGVVLNTFGREISARLGFEGSWSPAREGDRAVFLTGYSYGWTKRIAAVLFAQYLSEQLSDIKAVRLALRVSK